MITMIRNAGRIPYLAKIPAAYPPYDGFNTDIQEYNLVIDELVSENNIGVRPPDLYLFFTNNPGQISDDGLHPNGNGYISIAQLWRDAMLSLLP
jgi:lysophospholipase L1-like esterase